MGAAGGRRSGGGLVKISFTLESGAWHGSATETLWAQKVADDRYRLRNTPFYAFGVSVEDVVFARDEGGILSFDRVSLHSGHSTYRIIQLKGVSSERVEEYWKPIERIGCSYEEGSGGLRAVDVPPEVDVRKVYELLEQGEAEQVWGFEEGHCGHPIENEQAAE